MFLHHTMTDAEILRTCEGCESPHLRLVADRLRTRVNDLHAIHKTAGAARLSFDIDDIQDALREIQDTAKPAR